MTDLKQQGETKKDKKERLRDIFKSPNLTKSSPEREVNRHLIKVSERKNRNRKEAVFQKIMTKMFPE